MGPARCMESALRVQCWCRHCRRITHRGSNCGAAAREAAEARWTQAFSGKRFRSKDLGSFRRSPGLLVDGLLVFRAALQKRPGAFRQLWPTSCSSAIVGFPALLMLPAGFWCFRRSSVHAADGPNLSTWLGRVAPSTWDPGRAWRRPALSEPLRSDPAGVPAASSSWLQGPPGVSPHPRACRLRSLEGACSATVNQ